MNSIIGEVDLLVWLLMAAYTFSLYTIVFFLYSHVTMTKRQVALFLPAIFVWVLIETYFVCLPSSPIQIVMCNVMELSWLLPTVYLFTDHFSLNLIRFSVVSWIANGAVMLVLQMYNPADAVSFSGKQLDLISPSSMAVFTISVAAVVILEYPVIHWLMRYRPQLDLLYKTLTGCYLCIIFFDLFVELRAAFKGEFVWRAEIKGATGLLFAVCMIFMAVLIKRNGLSVQRQQLEKRIEILNSRYEEVVSKNRELHKLKHELNKQAEMIRAVEGYVPEEVSHNIMKSMGAKLNQSLAGMSISGNLMLDTMLEKHYRELEKRGIVLETILAPVKLQPDVEDSILMIQEEMFGYIRQFENDCTWIRYSFRVSGASAFIVMEIGLSNESYYKKQKVKNIIGDSLFVRQTFAQIAPVIAKRDGSMNYQLDRKNISIGVMVRI